MSPTPAKFRGSEVIYLFLAVGVAFELASLVMIFRGVAGRIPVLMPIGLGLIMLALVLVFLRARRQPPGDGPTGR